MIFLSVYCPANNTVFLSKSQDRLPLRQFRLVIANAPVFQKADATILIADPQATFAWSKQRSYRSRLKWFSDRWIELFERISIKTVEAMIGFDPQIAILGLGQGSHAGGRATFPGP